MFRFKHLREYEIVLVFHTNFIGTENSKLFSRFYFQFLIRFGKMLLTAILN